MANIKVRHFVSRRRNDGTVRYYWQPTAALRAAGFMPRRLNDDRSEAIRQADAMNGEVDKWRSGIDAAREIDATVQPGTVANLIRAFKTAPAWSSLAPRTQSDYAKQLAKVELWAGNKPTVALTSGHINTLYEALYKRSPTQANYCMRVLRLLLDYGKLKHGLRENPARDVKLTGVAPRLRVWSPAEIDALVAAADSLGRPSIGDAVLIAVDTGQREGDVLILPRLAVQAGDAGAITLRVRQSKRRKPVSVDLTPRLHARLAAILARRPANAEDPALILSEETGRHYRADNFRHWFGRVRKLAAQGDSTRELAPCLSLAPQFAGSFDEAMTLIAGVEPPPLERDIADLRAMAAKPKLWRARVADWRATFQDLRDTLVTRMAVAGCTIGQIASVTGQSERAIYSILPHYLALGDEMARAAVQRLIDHEAEPEADAGDNLARTAMAQLAAFESGSTTRH